MSPVQANCPGCGAAVRFKIGSAVVTVCEFCRSVVARGDRKFEDLGKVAAVVDTGSPLQLWLEGRYEGVRFTLTGRAQRAHPAGGTWDEWYAAFADGRWGWLAEAQGRYYMTFEHTLPADLALPEFDDLKLGQQLSSLPGAPTMAVAEKGWATPTAAEGEIPYLLVPGQANAYADLSGPGGAFGTLDYGDSPPLFYFGRQVTLDDLGVPEEIIRRAEARSVEALHVNCPNCGGALDLRAPDQTQRVACPNCGGLLACDQGNLRFLQALEPSEVEPAIPLGTVGTYGGHNWTVIGFMQRSVEVEGTRYFWEEYLLYEPRQGFRWLVRSDDHWSFVAPLPPGDVSGGYRTATYDGKDFKLFQSAEARVEHVLGEFYWQVTAGETVRARDYVRPPEMLSQELTEADGQGEINWSHGTYLPVAEVEKAFGMSRLPRPSKVAPNQPFLYGSIYKYWLILSAAAFLLGLFFLASGSNRKVFEKTYTVAPVAAPAAPPAGGPAPAAGQAPADPNLFFETIELEGRRNIRVRASSPNLSNAWLHVEGDLVDEETGLVQPFDIPVEFYQGVEDGEAWSEGNRDYSVYLSAVPAGKYALRLHVEGATGSQPVTLNVRVDQGVPRVWHWLLTLFALGVVPGVVLLYQLSFEHRRWQDSNVAE